MKIHWVMRELAAGMARRWGGEEGVYTTTPKEKMSDGMPCFAWVHDSGLLHSWLTQSTPFKYFLGGRMTPSSKSEICTLVAVKVPFVCS